MLLNDLDKAVEICAELGSLLHVIVYHAVRYLNSNLSETQAGGFIDEYFDTFKHYNGNKWGCGYLKAKEGQHTTAPICTTDELQYPRSSDGRPPFLRLTLVLDQVSAAIAVQV